MSDDRLKQTYPDILLEDAAPALTRLVRDLDTVARATVPPPGLAQSLERALRDRTIARPRHPWLSSHIHLPRRLTRRTRAFPVAFLLIMLLAGAAYHMIPIVERAFFVDAGTQQILNGNLATHLNLTATTGGYTVTLQRAYADVNRIVVGYTVRARDGRPFNGFLQEAFLKDSLKDGTGHVLPPLGGGTFVEGGAVLDNFDASSIPGMPKDLTLQLTIPGPQVLKEGRWVAPEVGRSLPATFHFSVPLHGGRVADLHQTVSAGGMAVTLEQAVISPSEARFYLRGLDGTGIEPHLTVDGWDSNKVKLVGWESTPTYTSASQILRGVWETNTRLVVCDFPAALMDKHGEWTLSIKAGPATADGRRVTGGPWVFHFVVP